jgi:hypothetical protein
MRLTSSCHALSAALLLTACTTESRQPGAATSDSAITDAIGGALNDQVGTPLPVMDTAWTVLFDGTSTAAFRGFKRADMPAGWQIVDGALTRVEPAGDFITKDMYADFEFELEFRVDPGANSGIMYRVTEADSNTYRTGPEYQILDDARHGDGKDPLKQVAALYDLYPRRTNPVKPAGDWNAARIVIRKNVVEHWLNNEMVVTYDLAGPEFAAKVAASKFQYWPGFGKAPRGHIAIQDHGDRVAFRNIRIRAL